MHGGQVGVYRLDTALDDGDEEESDLTSISCMVGRLVFIGLLTALDDGDEEESDLTSISCMVGRLVFIG